MMKFLIRSFIFFSWMLSGIFFAFAETLDSFQFLLPLLKDRVPAQTLILWDLDLTLLQPQHPALFYSNLKTYFSSYEKSLEGLSGELKDELLSSLLLQFKAQPVEPGESRLIRHLQKQGFHMLALTASLTGKVGSETSFERFRWRQLKALGIEFQFPRIQKQSQKQPLLLSELPSYHRSFPSFYRGILSANGEKGPTHKGSTLVAFLKRISWRPRTIFFIDDRVKNIEEVQQALGAAFPEIEYVGMHYRGAFQKIPPVISEQAFQDFWEDQAEKIMPSSECFLLSQVKGSPQVKKGKLCTTRKVPCSTFKCPLALLGYDAGILETDKTPEWTFPTQETTWTPPFLEGQKGIQTPRSWMQYSTVWFSEALVEKLGFSRIKQGLSLLRYGNQNCTGFQGRPFWFNSLEISPREQLAFLQAWAQKRLPFPREAQEKAFALLPEEEMDIPGVRLFAKIGSCSAASQKIGWYIGRVEFQNPSNPPLLFVQLSLLNPKDLLQHARLRAKPRALRRIREFLKGQQRRGV